MVNSSISKSMRMVGGLSSIVVVLIVIAIGAFIYMYWSKMTPTPRLGRPIRDPCMNSSHGFSPNGTQCSCNQNCLSNNCSSTLNGDGTINLGVCYDPNNPYGP